MKLKNIVAAISFLFMAVSCSMEDDVLNELTKSETPNNSNQTEVYLSVNAVVNAVNTKGGYSEEPEDTKGDTYAYCSIILCEGETIIGVYDHVDATDATSKKFLVKTGRFYEVLVVADADKSYAFSSYTKKSDILSHVLGSVDMNGPVKFGRKSFVAGANGGTSSAINNVAEETITVQLEQLTAKVRLMEVNVTFASGAKEGAVTLENVQLINQKIKATIDAAKEGSASITDPFTTTSDWTAGQAISFSKTEDKKYQAKYDDGKALAEFFTFPNEYPTTDEEKTALSFVLDIDGRWEDVERSYVINRETDTENGFTNGTSHQYIKAGYIYQLYVNVKVTEEDILCTLTFKVMDWNLKEEVWAYTDAVTYSEGNSLKWTANTYTNIDKYNAILYMDSYKEAVCTFLLDTPTDATWYASLITVEGEADAFEFVGDSSGEVGKLATLQIRTKNTSTQQTNKARLEIVVVNVNGDTMIADVLDPTEYNNNSYMTIVQNN